VTRCHRRARAPRVSTAERRAPDGTFHPAPDALPNEKARPIALRRQLEGVARLARGDALEAAVSGARAFVRAAILTAPRLGGGCGPVNHFAPIE
jgi:hypothetical protein